MRGSEREVEDILLSEVTAGVRARVTGRVFCIKRSKRKQNREIAKGKYRFKKYQEIGPFNNRD